MTDIAVVIPTFDRAHLLRLTLQSLSRQSLDRERFEVVVSDDGSSDDTVDVVRSFTDRMTLRYTYQHDLGYRSACARNAGAALARAPIVAFMDAGTIATEGLLAEHVRAHTANRPGDTSFKLVVGRVIGYDTGASPNGELAALLDAGAPIDDDVIRRLRLSDMRDRELDRFARSLSRLHLPWRLSWTVNLSVSTRAFEAVGGFDDTFTGWGAEDMELAYRVNHAGAAFEWLDDAVAVEYPHHRDTAANVDNNIRNLKLLHEKHPNPEVELFLAARRTGEDVHDTIDEYRQWAASVAPAATDGPSAPSTDTSALLGRDAVLGLVPTHDSDVLVNPFGPNSPANAGRTTHCALGIHTRLPARCFRRVVVSDYFGPLWSRWSDLIMAEAKRIADDVEVLAPS